MLIKSLFYLDINEIELLYSQLYQEDTDKKITINEERNVNGTISLGLNGIINSFLSSELSGNGELRSSIVEEMNLKTSQSDKVFFNNKLL